MRRYGERRAQAVRGMQDAGITSMVITPSSDFLYLTGDGRQPTQRLVALVLGQDNPRVLLPAFELEGSATILNGLEPVVYSDEDDPIDCLAALLPTQGRIAVGREMRAAWVLAIQAKLGVGQLHNADEILAPIRCIKSAAEVDLLKTAQHKAEGALERLLKEDLCGQSECEIAARLMELRLQEGFDSVGSGIVASGSNSAFPHYINDDRVVQAGDALLFDIGGTYHGYRADMSRTFAVGCIPEGFDMLYAIVLQAHEAGVQAVRPGVPAREVDAAARRVITDAGYGQYFTHRLGHGIGLDIHEPPYLNASNDYVLQEGNVFSCEPGIYLPGRFGIRIEDLLVVEAAGARSLNHMSKALRVL